MKIKTLHAIIPIVIINNEAFTTFLASSNFPSENNFPKNLWEPRGIPTDATDTKIIAREIMDDDIPITSGVVILDKIYQKA